MEAQETVRAEGPTVCCDGNGGPLGHPAVYLTFGRDGVIICPYCSRRFVRVEGRHEATGT